jgi:hypothetical protein
MTYGNSLLGAYGRRGEACAVVIPTSASYDDTMQLNTIATATIAVTGIIRSYSVNEVGGADGLIALGDREVSIDGGQFAGVLPDPSARIVVEGTNQEVVRRWAVKAGAQIITLLYHIRGSI